MDKAFLGEESVSYLEGNLYGKVEGSGSEEEEREEELVNAPVRILSKISYSYIFLIFSYY